VFEALARMGGHRTAEEIYEVVRIQYPSVNLSTIYRNLDLGVELGLVTETDLGGGTRRFELVRAGRHHHLICQRCGAIAELADDLLEPLRVALQERYGFLARMDHFAIFGTCARCRATRHTSEENTPG
jgi:Fur family ferric uptake transcriptional regulator